ncbi:hypothetical protein DSO57_1012242 [Entomophthora muscae]|uniref:Uncharacterized protein n=1 Tax=Entomophthora muscae TaxID=34485 RepID=A0ACC2S7X6_9FUNG|nr:hypothetical protein DSO57_1012242 [Entomophthora muscae]
MPNYRHGNKLPSVVKFIHSFVENYPEYVKNGIHIFSQSYDAYAAIVAANVIKTLTFESTPNPILLSIGMGAPIIDMQIQMLGYPESMRRMDPKHKFTGMLKQLQRIDNMCYLCTGLKQSHPCKRMGRRLFKAAFVPYLSAHHLMNNHGFSYKELNARVQEAENLFWNSTTFHRYSMPRVQHKVSLCDKDFSPHQKPM